MFDIALKSLKLVFVFSRKKNTLGVLFRSVFKEQIVHQY
ncbi:hypothetical protein JOC77_004318 [Peribacillus deserti]|uniref:Uncharacterized protein n=1 Tax=Peribacillus deserti TaxID=673318 RepID=A0ABS2QNU3_9BACI|nr:hypothetical protein [Peribacillus deserti]